MTPLIMRNTTIPVKATKKFSTNVDNQTSVMVQVFEGERAMTRDCNLLGRFTLEDIPPKPRGHPRIKVTYSIDANGILNVSAEEKSTKKVTKITITHDKGRLSGEEIQKMCDEARDFEEKDTDARKLAYAKIELENYINTAADIVASSDASAADADGDSTDGEDDLNADGSDDDSLPDLDGADDDAGPPGLDGEDDDGPPGLDGEDDDGPPGLDGEDDDGPPGLGGEDDDGPPGLGGEDDDGPPGLGGEDDDGPPPPVDAPKDPVPPPAPTEATTTAKGDDADESDDDSLPPLDEAGESAAEVVVEDGGSDDDSLPNLDGEPEGGAAKSGAAATGMRAQEAKAKLKEVIKTTKEWLARDRVISASAFFY